MSDRPPSSRDGVPRPPLPSPSALLQAYGRPAKKRFGQNFLSDPELLDRVVRAARVAPGDRVLEIGPGPGGLTTRLLAAGAELCALEADPDLVEHLGRAFAGHRIDVRHGDALTDDLDAALGDPCANVVANLPYHLATEILFRLVDRPDPPARMALMFQREVAERVVSRGAARDFGPLAVGTAIRFATRIALRLPPGAFRPPPKVHSAVVAFERLDTPRCDAATERATRHLARLAFQQRRKMLRGSLGKRVPGALEALEAVGISPTARPESLDVDAFVALGQKWRELGQDVTDTANE